MNYNFTFIIGYRHSEFRLNNLKKVLFWINGFTGAEVILVEQDKHSKINHLNLNCKYIFTKTDRPYNRSWAFNVGLKNANSNIIIFGDSDLIIEPNLFIDAIRKTKEYDMVSPYNKVVDLDPNESNLDFESIFNIRKIGRGENDNQKINIAGGISIFRRDAILKIGGWEEAFESWGGEDDFLTIYIKKFLKHIEMEGNSYHLHHPKAIIDKNAYERNISLLGSISKLNDVQLTNRLNNRIERIGLKNKYDL